MTLLREDVGKRVIVRRLLPGEVGPSGGPAMTDVLGILVEFEDTFLVVEREDGQRIVVPQTEVVTGKPIPPRPVRRPCT